MKEYVSCRELAQMLGVCRSRVHQMVRSGAIVPACRIGKAVGFDRKYATILAKIRRDELEQQRPRGSDQEASITDVPSIS